MNAFFTDLGRRVSARWIGHNFSQEVFPELAASALNERRPSEHVDLGDLMREFLLEDTQPFQTGSGFGQPELVVYDDQRFYIQALFWMEGNVDSRRGISRSAGSSRGRASDHLPDCVAVFYQRRKSATSGENP